MVRRWIKIADRLAESGLTEQLQLAFEWLYVTASGLAFEGSSASASSATRTRGGGAGRWTRNANVVCPSWFGSTRVSCPLDRSGATSHSGRSAIPSPWTARSRSSKTLFVRNAPSTGTLVVLPLRDSFHTTAL